MIIRGVKVMEPHMASSILGVKESLCSFHRSELFVCSAGVSGKAEVDI